MSALAWLALAAALAAGLATGHGFAFHGWGPRLAARLRRQDPPPPTPHHARHLARLRRLRGH